MTGTVKIRDVAAKWDDQQRMGVSLIVGCALGMDPEDIASAIQQYVDFGAPETTWCSMTNQRGTACRKGSVMKVFGWNVCTTHMDSFLEIASRVAADPSQPGAWRIADGVAATLVSEAGRSLAPWSETSRAVDSLIQQRLTERWSA